ncbi:MAG: hypothetical protein K0M69_00440 [Youngiibacter sp.]|jgi:hypothetical protein|nr:hypothetical protein [Youngiibacter sp.]
MSEQIYLHEYRNIVDDQFVGFKPNGASVKPVHIAGGSLRSIYGAIADTKKIKKLSYVSNAAGKIPSGNENAAVYAFLTETERIDEEVGENELESMRNVMQKLLAADKGVYSGTTDGMVSYSAGSKYFITKKAMYEDAGEFIGGVIKQYCPELASYIKKNLDLANDPITLLFSPVLEDEPEMTFENSVNEDIPAFKHKSSAMEWYLSGIKCGGQCLLENLKSHPNHLTQLRLFNFFCIFHLMRYLAMLEAFYCEESVRPILLDFTKNSGSSISRASQMSYTQMHRSISRFYAWAYAQHLGSLSNDELMNLETPVYDAKKVSKTGKDELDHMWSLAKEEAMQCTTDDDSRLIFGTTIYDMLALEASSHPVNYLKAISTQVGILYPPDNLHPNKRFVLSQDVLEMLLRCCVTPSEVLNATELRSRLWERFGVIVGGSAFELDKLHNNGSILQVDEDSLEDNFNAFASMLESMDFAEIMADGILQIRLGGADN